MKENRTLYLPSEEPLAQRESLTFDIDTKQLPPDIAELVETIKKVAETVLFHWTDVSIVLPESITERRAKLSSVDGDSYIDLKQLFIAPLFDELEVVSSDGSGKLKRLNEAQLSQIRRQGEFEVPSLNFPGQIHRWRLSRLLQKGSERSQESLLKDISNCVWLLIVVARNRFCSSFFSVKEAAKGWARGLWHLLDILIGVPSTSPGDIGQKLHEERMRYLVAELDIKPSSKRELNTYCQYIKSQCLGLQINKHKISDFRPPPIPYRYQTPKGQDIDLRLFSKDLMNNCMGILSNILDRQAKNWPVQMRSKLMRHFQGQGLSNQEIAKRVNQSILDHYLSKVFEAITMNAEIEVLQPGLGLLLVQQAKTVIAMMKAQQNLRQRLSEQKEMLLKHLKTTYPIRSLIPSWSQEQVRLFELEFTRQNLLTAHEEAIALCEQEHLDQAVYFLRRDLNFIKEREAVLRKELAKVTVPSQEFVFSTRIWLPQNWVVRRCHLGTKSQTINTVIWETEPLQSGTLDPNTSFTIQKSTERVTSTRYPFWRWWNFLQRAWSNVWNAMFVCGIVVPWCSPVSIRALFWPVSFVPDLEQSQIDGSLFPRESSRTHSLVSRLMALWNNVTSSREQFELTPDKGFLGKNLTRHINRLWNYVIKGAIGSLLIVLVFPATCLFCSILSLAAAVLAPVWAPITTLMAHLFFVLVWDMDSPSGQRNRFSILCEALVWNILLQGCLQPLLALFVGAVLCPLASSAVFLYAISHRCLRYVWDASMFHIIIKNRARVPSSDSFVAKRIAGPGLASNYFFQIRPEQALAALEADIEQDELAAWRKHMLSVIEQPKQVYQNFVEQCFKPFSAVLSDRGLFLTLSQETAEFVHKLTAQYSQRKAKLSTGLNPDLQKRIKLPENDLKLTVAYAAKILEELYPDHVLRFTGLPEDQFWESLSLEFRDWKALAVKKLKEIFSSSFMIPLEETDNYFQLQVQHLSIQAYIQMLSSGTYHDDLESTVELDIPEVDVSYQAPYFDVLLFDPERRHPYSSLFLQTNSAHYDGSQNRENPVSFDKLEIPLSIPHPAHIAIAIYNRENDTEPIDLSDARCQKIVRATKEVPFVDLTDVSSIEPSNTELSTPDIGSETVPATAYLAMQERSFSDDAIGMITSSASQDRPSSQTEADDRLGQGSRVIYYEIEKDTSCVMNVSDNVSVSHK